MRALTSTEVLLPFILHLITIRKMCWKQDMISTLRKWSGTDSARDCADLCSECRRWFFIWWPLGANKAAKVQFLSRCPFRLLDLAELQQLSCYQHKKSYTSFLRYKNCSDAYKAKFRAFGHMRTAKALIRLRECAVWSGPSLSANRIIGYYRVYEWRTRIIVCACAGQSESAHFAHVRGYCFAWHGPYKNTKDKTIINKYQKC